MSKILQAISRHDPDKIALAGHGRALTYGQLQAAIENTAKKLSGVSVLGIALDNGPDWMIWDLAAVRAGIVCVPLPPFFNDQQRNHVILSAGITHIISAGGLHATGVLPINAIPNGTAKITFTSGTTGTPKGVCLPQGGMEQVAQSLVEVLGAELAERHLSVLPLSILLENIAGVYASLLAGGTCHLYGLENIGMANPFQPDFVRLAHVMSTHKITSAILVPELLRGLIQVVMQTGLTLPSLRFLAVGGSKVSPALVMGARSLGLPVYEGYGLSECASVVSLNTPQHDKPGTAGKVLPHIRLAEQDSEIVIGNPAFLGYIGDGLNGSFATGDLGRVDEAGFVHIDGRRKNVLITAHGRNISPEWVESVLLASPEILQVLVYGDAAPHLGALIVPVHEEVDLAQAIEQANVELPPYAQIKEFHAVPPFSMQDGTLTGTGRPRRAAIFQKHQSLMSMEYEYELLQTSG